MFFNNQQKYKSYDLVVVGNTLSAVISAGMAAKSGKSVALVTSSELLFSEYSEGLIGFAKKDSSIFSLLQSMGAVPENIGEEYHIPAGMASKIALSFLKQHNVNVYLKAAPIGLLKSKEKICGIAVATKFGAYALKSSFVANFDNRIFYKSEEIENEYVYAFQMGGVDLTEITTPYNINTNLNGIKDVTIHSDCRSNDTCVITFITDKNETSKASEQAIELIGFLIKNNHAFQKSGLLKFSLKPVSTTSYYNTPKKNLLEFKAGNILEEEDYCSAITFATALINKFLENLDYTEPTILETTYGEYNLAQLYTGEELDEYLGAELLKIKIPTENAPVKKTSLFIAGLGAGGAAAMKSALEMGCDVIGAEALATPAGTRGQGMVSAFWHGYQNGFATQNIMEIKKFSKANLGSSVPTYTAEMLYDFSFMNSANATFYESIVFDALKNGNDTIGALLATPNGIVKIIANKCIDATGDADLAALAGVEYSQSGDYRDKVTQGYSIWGEEKKGTPFPDSLYKSDEDNISTEKYSEFLRGIYTAQLKQSDLGFSALLTVRESRRIKGKYILNMKDILRGEVFDDTIALSLCKYDAHGMGSSPVYYTTIFNALKSKENGEVVTRIPLRALLPEKDNGLMVISKSISATRDAGCLIRMNPDIQNTGYAAGLVAANSAKNDLDFESGFTNEIKNLLLEKQLLPDYYNQKPSTQSAELIEKIKSGDVWSIAIASACNENIFDFEAAYENEENLALVLLALGSETPFDDILNKLNNALELHSKENNQAVKIKTYSILLSRIAAKNKDKKSALLPALVKAIELLEAGGGYGNPAYGIYQNSKVSNRIIPNYKEILGVVIAAETVADKVLAEPLMKLSEKKNIRLSDGDEIHSVQLYLRIMAAAARCGDKNAKSELEKYINSDRLFFREFAKNELDILNSSSNDFSPVKIEEFWV